MFDIKSHRRIHATPYTGYESIKNIANHEQYRYMQGIIRRRITHITTVVSGGTACAIPIYATLTHWISSDTILHHNAHFPLYTHTAIHNAHVFGLCETDTERNVPSGKTRRRQLRSRIWWFTEFCNSHYVSHFAALFIVTRTKISVAKSCFLFCLLTYCTLTLKTTIN